MILCFFLLPVMNGWAFNNEELSLYEILEKKPVILTKYKHKNLSEYIQEKPQNKPLQQKKYRGYVGKKHYHIGYRQNEADGLWYPLAAFEKNIVLSKENTEIQKLIEELIK